VVVEYSPFKKSEIDISYYSSAEQPSFEYWPAGEKEPVFDAYDTKRLK